MPVKITTIQVRPNVNVPFPSASMFGEDGEKYNRRTWDGLLDSTKEVSADGLTMRSLEIWRDGYPNYENLTADQKRVSEKFIKYIADNNIIVSKTVEQI